MSSHLEKPRNTRTSNWPSSRRASGATVIPAPVYGPIEMVTMSARVRVVPSSMLEEHPSRTVAKRHPDRAEDGHPVAVVEALRFAEDRGVHPDGSRLEESHAAAVGGLGLARVDHGDPGAGDQGRSSLEIARDVERAGDVHDAAQRQDRERGRAVEQVFGDEADRAIAPGRHDDIDAVRDGGSHRGARGGLVGRLHDVLTETVAFGERTELIRRAAVRRDAALRSRTRVADDAVAPRDIGRADLRGRAICHARIRRGFGHGRTPARAALIRRYRPVRPMR